MTVQLKKTILFVDDERSILSSLRRLLRREGWNLLTATSGSQGLAILRENPVDVVVSDMRMPDMDGAAFLKKVREVYPYVARIALTGFAHQEPVIRAFTEAGVQQIIGKPWDGEELKHILRRVLHQSEQQEKDLHGLRPFILELDALPPLPVLHAKLRSMMNKSAEYSIGDIARVIEQDSSVATKIMQIANSPFFGQMQQVETVNRALVVLGLKMIGYLVLSTSVFQTLFPENIEGLSQEDLFKHSIGCGLIARFLAEKTSQKPEFQEKVLLAASLHDVGLQVLAKALPERHREITRTSHQRQTPRPQVEQEMLGVTHAAVGAHLLDWWNLPAGIVDAVRWHNDPSLSQEKNSALVCIVHLADALAQRLRIFPDEAYEVPEIHPFASATLGLDCGAVEDILIELEPLIDGTALIS